MHAALLPNLASALWSLLLHVKPPSRRPPAWPVHCAGTDSLAGDRLGVFNLSSDGHAACVSHMMSYGVPLMLLGGGGGSPHIFNKQNTDRPHAGLPSTQWLVAVCLLEPHNTSLLQHAAHSLS